MFCWRFSAQKRSCSYTHKRICAKRSPTSAHSAVRPSPTVPTYPNTPGSTWGLNRTVARSARGSSPNCRTCNSTLGLTRGTNLISESEKHFDNFCFYSLFEITRCRHPGCQKAFSQLSNLQSHSRCHQTDKPYKCNSCYKCFSDEPSLLEHIPKHKESKHLKTHICQYCGKSYTQETYLSKHMQKHAERTDKRPPIGATLGECFY